MDCRDCKDRRVGCHSTCEIYKKYKEKIDSDNELRRAKISKWSSSYYHK